MDALQISVEQAEPKKEPRMKLRGPLKTAKKQGPEKDPPPKK
jgi:hypothetical protein